MMMKMVLRRLAGENGTVVHPSSPGPALQAPPAGRERPKTTTTREDAEMKTTTTHRSDVLRGLVSVMKVHRTGQKNKMHTPQREGRNR